MKSNVLILLFTTLTLMYACGSKNSEPKESVSIAHDMDMAAPASIEADGPPAPPPPPSEKIRIDKIENELSNDPSHVREKKIIKDGNIAVRTKDIHASKKVIDGLVQSLNAYYESENLQNNDQEIYYSLKIRIPAEHFEKLISGIENGKDEIIDKSIHVRDVTEEYVDIEIRLTNKKEYLERYKELLSKASTVKEILEIEENIRSLEEEIESQEGRLKFLNDQVAFSTLELEINQGKEYVYKPQPQDKFSERFKKSISNGWNSIVGFIVGVITIWPYLLIACIAFYLYKRRMKKKRAVQN